MIKVSRTTKIHNPIKGYKNKYVPKGHVTQFFGENVELYMAAIGTNGHTGIDIVAPHGTPMYAVEGGIVCDVKEDPSGYGKHLRILTQSGDKIEREWTYGHNSANYVKIGDVVKAGQYIADMGNTGFVVSSFDKNAHGFWDRGGNNYAGTHLHLGLREFIYDKRGWRYNDKTPRITTLNYENGFKGSLDFEELFQDGVNGDFEILKRELEKSGEEDWYMKLIRGLRFFGH